MTTPFSTQHKFFHQGAAVRTIVHDGGGSRSGSGSCSCGRVVHALGSIVPTWANGHVGCSGGRQVQVVSGVLPCHLLQLLQLRHGTKVACQPQG